MYTPLAIQEAYESGISIAVVKRNGEAAKEVSAGTQLWDTTEAPSGWSCLRPWTAAPLANGMAIPCEARLAMNADKTTVS